MYFGTLFAAASKLMRCRSGNFASIFAIAAPVLLGLAGGAIDLIVYNRQESAMQNAADAAVLAATREATLKSWSQGAVETVGRAYVEAELEDAGVTSTALFSVKTIVDNAAKQVSITVDMDQHRYFVLGYFRKSPQIRVQATAKLSSETPLCMIALESSAASALAVSKSAGIHADGCAAYSNSTSPAAVDVEKQALLRTAFTCSAGGYRGAGSSFAPTPTTDCPAMPDPLSERPQPVAGACDHKKYSIKNTAVTLDPGVYCGGLAVDNSASVTLKPGVYIINGGAFSAKNNGSVVGTGVTIYFTGVDGRMVFDGTTTIDLTAPASGPTAGMLLFQDKAMALTDYEISSKLAAKLLGTIYLPNGRFIVNAPGKVADQSAFTVVVAKTVLIGDSSQMYLNSNYVATNVPVPAGLGPSGKVVLAK